MERKELALAVDNSEDGRQLRPERRSLSKLFDNFRHVCDFHHRKNGDIQNGVVVLSEKQKRTVN